MMSYRKHGLGLLIILIGMMAFASSAHAALGFRFNLGAALHASIGAEQTSIWILLVPNSNLEMRCTKFTIQTGLIVNSTHAQGTLTYHECISFVHSTGQENKPCHIVFSQSDSKLNVASSSLILPAELLSGAPAILIEGVVMLILFLGAECTLPEDNKVIGEFCLAVTDNITVKPLISASAHIQTLCKPRNALEGIEQNSGGFKDELKYGKNPAQILGQARVFLIAAHEGQTLSVELF